MERGIKKKIIEREERRGEFQTWGLKLFFSLFSIQQAKPANVPSCSRIEK
jgi:hypothetical protein